MFTRDSCRPTCIYQWSWSHFYCTCKKRNCLLESCTLSLYLLNDSYFFQILNFSIKKVNTYEIRPINLHTKVKESHKDANYIKKGGHCCLPSSSIVRRRQKQLWSMITFLIKGSHSSRMQIWQQGFTNQPAKRHR